MVDLVSGATEKDLVICLISGGGSALMPLPMEGISLQQKQEVTKLFLACGATINEMNALRKHISRVKGGQLARLAAPATLLSLILSDVVGDPLDVIASGMTVPDTSTFEEVFLNSISHHVSLSFKYWNHRTTFTHSLMVNFIRISPWRHSSSYILIHFINVDSLIPSDIEVRLYILAKGIYHLFRPFLKCKASFLYALLE